MKRNKPGLKATGFALLVCIVAVGVLSQSCAHMPKALGPVDHDGLIDGVYSGYYAWFPVKASVEVTIEDSKIADIKIVKHRAHRGRKAESPVPNRIISRQSTQVDAVTGATRSSLVIMGAVQDAIRKACKSD
jgi:uncharacterized protein with FMN-binding domain